MKTISFTTIIKKFADKGEKTGWTYIEIPSELAIQLLPDNKKSFRVKGKLDTFTFEGVSLLPMGEGDFIMALNGTVRKSIKKQKGDSLKVQLSVDTNEKKLSEDFIECLEEDKRAFDFFNSIPKSHQKYYSNWIESAKTDATKAKRITMAIKGLAMKLSFGEMIKMNKKEPLS